MVAVRYFVQKYTCNSRTKQELTTKSGMTIIEEPMPGLLLLEPRVFRDGRGYFFESFNALQAREAGIICDFVQDNQSLSSRGVLRGLHFQAPPYAQDKLVRVIRGAVNDVVVDIRKGSPTYGRHYTAHLSADNFRMLFVPVGFAHGFETLENDTIFQYKCSNYYNKASEGGLHWNDPTLQIHWELDAPLVSDKDQELPFWENFESPFD
jgi:dTDP-4-dehydrorhamnose 3,5-epimerase